MVNDDIKDSKNLLQQLQKMNSYLDSNGDRIYQVPIPSSGAPSVCFNHQSSDPSHLAYFIVSYLDIKEMADAIEGITESHIKNNIDS